MPYPAQISIPASYLRGGTSKGVFFRLADLPPEAQQPGAARDALLLRIIGSPDPYGKQIDGLGGATSSTSKVAIVSPSQVPGHDVDYWFGQVAIDRPVVDWSGNCGNLSAAVGPFAIAQGLVDPARIPTDGVCDVRIRQANIGKTIINRVPITDGAVQETGDFYLDGVAFPAAEIQVEFVNPTDTGDALFPTGRPLETLVVPGVGTFEVTMINAGIQTIFLNAEDLGYDGTELQAAINGDPAALARFETLRAHGAVKMGLIGDVAEAAERQHTPKIAFCAPAKPYVAAGGRQVRAADIDLNVRAISMGQLHHAMMGTAAVAIAGAAAIPGTLVNRIIGGGQRDAVSFGHPAGTLKVGAVVHQSEGSWTIETVVMRRSARVLMEGRVRAPAQ